MPGARLGRGALVRREQTGVDEHVHGRSLRRGAAQSGGAADVRAQEGTCRLERCGQQQRGLCAVLQHRQRRETGRLCCRRELRCAVGVGSGDGVGLLQRQKARCVRLDEREQRRALRLTGVDERAQRVAALGIAGVCRRDVCGHRGQACRQCPGERGSASAARCGLCGGKLRGKIGKGQIHIKIPPDRGERSLLRRSQTGVCEGDGALRLTDGAHGAAAGRQVAHLRRKGFAGLLR